MVAYFLGVLEQLKSAIKCCSTKGPAHYIQTDTFGAWRCGAYFNEQWFQLQWDSQWKPHHIMVKELLPIVLSAAVWGPQLSRQAVMFQCDNSSVVTSLQKGLSKNSASIHLLQCLWFFTTDYNIDLVVNTYQGLITTLLIIHQGTTCTSSSPQILEHLSCQYHCHASFKESQQYLALIG